MTCPSPIAISIIVPTRERPEALATCLAAVRAEVEALGATSVCEVLVVDSAPATSRTAGVAREIAVTFPALRYLATVVSGSSHARNLGIARSHGAVLVFVDDDCVPQPGWLVGLTAGLRAGTTLAVQGGIEIAPERLRPWMTPLIRTCLASTEIFEGRAEDSLPEMFSANMAVARSVFGVVPGFDPVLGAGPDALGNCEDTLFSRQLRMAGIRIEAALAARVLHRFDVERLSRRSCIEAAVRLGRSYAYVDYHWEHREVSLASIHSRLAARRLARWRARQGAPSAEGIDPAEGWLLRTEAYWERYEQEQQQPRRYPPRGLVANLAPAPAEAVSA